tara:strand:- start:9355 stop:10008 length:654 start_codon:yes stop_codon:yes gene_type:complete
MGDNNNILICDKGDMMLSSYLIDNMKAYTLAFSLNEIDTSKINLQNLLSHNIYELLDKLNSDLIEKIEILKIYNDDMADVIILLKPIGKEFGLKQKYILFNTKRKMEININRVSFVNKDIFLTDETLATYYLEHINLDKNKYEPIIYNFGSVEIEITNNNLTDLINGKNSNKYIDVKFETRFQLILKDKLPVFMDNITGLIIKKMFYNLKVFLYKLV